MNFSLSAVDNQSSLCCFCLTSHFPFSTNPGEKVGYTHFHDNDGFNSIKYVENRLKEEKNYETIAVKSLFHHLRVRTRCMMGERSDTLREIQ